MSETMPGLTNHIMEKHERHFGVISEEEWDSIKARRERAYMWHMRWAMPTYDRMIKTVKESKGLDITVEDVDLLPWGTKGSRAFREEYQKMQKERYQPNMNKRPAPPPKKDNGDDEARRKKEAEEAERRRRQAEEEEEARRRRRNLPPKPTDGNTPVEKAYRWYVDLKKPTRDNMVAAIKKTTGMDISQSDVDKLPWNADGKTLDYPKLHDLLEKATGKKPDVLHEKDEPLLNLTRKHPADVKDLEQIEPILKAYDWYKDLKDPKLKTYRAVQDKTKGCDATKEAVLSLPWDDTQNYVDPQQMKAWQDRYKELQDEQDRKRLPPKPTNGNTPVEKAYRWYVDLKKPTRDNMVAAIKKTTGMDISQSDVDRLPWNPDGKTLDYPKLHDYLEKATGRKPEVMKEKDEPLLNVTPKDPANVKDLEQVEEILKAFDWYKDLKDPKLKTYRAVQDKTKGCDATKEAVLSLPWDRTQMYVDPKKMQAWRDRQKELQAERERRRKEDEDRKKLPPKPTNGNTPVEKAYRWYVDLKKPTRDNMVAAIKKTTGMDISQSDVDKLPWNPDGKTLDYPKLHDYLEKATGRKPEVMKEKDEPLLNVTPKDPANVNDLEQVEEILKAFDWYKDLKDPKLKTYRAVQDKTKGCDATKEAVLSLPWDPTQLYVDPKKMQAWRDRQKELEAERRQKDAEAERRRKEEEDRKKLPPKPTDGKTPIEKAYRWYVDLKKPTRDNMVAAIQKTKGMDIDKSDVDKLPWNSDGQTLNYPKLHDLLEKATGRKPDVMEDKDEPLMKISPKDPADVNDLEQCADILKAYDWYKDLKDPKLKTYRAVQDETTGCDAKKEAVKALPWDATQTYVDPKKMKDWQDRFNELDKERRRREADAQARRRAEKELEKRREENHDRAQRLAERNRQNKILKYSLEEANAKRQKSYMWYARLGQPNRTKMKKLVAGLPDSCDIVVDDVDLLPWTCAGLALDVHKMNKLFTGDDLDKMKAQLSGDDDDDSD